MGSLEVRDAGQKPEEEKAPLIVGAKIREDGSIDDSKAMTWDRTAQDQESKVGNPQFRPDIEKIMGFLDGLGKLLNLDTLVPTWPPLNVQLNYNFMGITDFVRVLDQVSQEEYEALIRKVEEIEPKVAPALEACRAESKISGSYVPDGVITGLERDIPATMKSLRSLESKIK